MNPYSEDGVLVLADISGFTEFVSATELEHGPPIIAALLEEVMGKLSPPMEIQEVEGDAVFALAPDRILAPPAHLLDVLDQAFAAFKARQRELQADGAAAARRAATSGGSTSRSWRITGASSASSSAAAARWRGST
jgi:hypothetical protein